MKQTYIEFWRFLKSPSFLLLKSDKKNVWRDFKWLFLLDILFAAILMGIYEAFLHFNWIKEYKGMDLLKEYGIFWGIVIACIAAPIMEEFLFRWHLRKRYASIYFFALGIATILIFNVEYTFLNWPIFLTALLVAYIFHRHLTKKGQTQSQAIWQKSYPAIFYGSALIFGWVHLSNIEGLTLADPSFVFYIGSQAFGALALGYLCVKYGLKYSILFHACFNAFGMIIELISGNY